MNLALSSSQLRRTRCFSALLTGALLTGAGAAHAQTFSTQYVAPSQVLQFTTTTNASSPTYSRSLISPGLNIYSPTNPPASSGTGSAVAYATSSTYTPTATGPYTSYTVTTSATGYDPGNYLQYIYSPGLNPTNKTTALQGLDYGYRPNNASNSGSYTVNLSGGNAYQFVDTGLYSPSKSSQAPGSGTDSVGMATTTVIYNGSQQSIPDNNTTGISQSINVTSANYVTAFNSITIDNLTHPLIGDLVATLSHNGISVDLFDHVNADNNPNDPNYNYGQGSQASFDGNNYTFSLTGASLSTVADFTNAPDGTVYAASGNALGGYDTANAGNTLNSFFGQTLGGAWTLTLKDEQPDDVGSFNGFSFGVNSAPIPEASTGLGFGMLLSLIVLGRAGQVLNARRRSAQSAFAE